VLVDVEDLGSIVEEVSPRIGPKTNSCSRNKGLVVSTVVVFVCNRR
jgi:hypothetical protein